MVRRSWERKLEMKQCKKLRTTQVERRHMWVRKHLVFAEVRRGAAREGLQPCSSETSVKVGMQHTFKMCFLP